jgi:RimJ/RimL family protein N-acetyltransferase
MLNERPSVMISALRDEQVPLYKELRLRGLRDHPGAFVETPEAFETRSVGAIAERMRESQAHGGFTLIARDTQRGLIGTASLGVGSTPKEAHRGVVWGVYVVPEARRMGVGGLLLNDLIDRASRTNGLRNLTLTVASANQPALRLYQSLGFTEFGFDRDALYVNGEFVSEILMSRELANRG